MKLQKKIRADAEVELDELIKKVRNAVTEIIDPARIMSADIVRLAFGNRTAAVRKKCVAQIANRKEEELYEKYNSSEETVISDNIIVDSLDSLITR